MYFLNYGKKICNSGPIKVTEHQLPEDEVIAMFLAEDKDSGAFGQVVYSLAPGQADEVGVYIWG